MSATDSPVAAQLGGMNNDAASSTDLVNHVLVGCGSDWLVMGVNNHASDLDNWSQEDEGKLLAISAQCRRSDRALPLPAIWQWASFDDYTQYQHEVWGLARMDAIDLFWDMWSKLSKVHGRTDVVAEQYHYIYAPLTILLP